MRALLRILLAAVTAGVLGPAAPAPAKVRIVATVFPLREFAAAVAGERGEASLLLPTGAGVHTWQPRPADIARLADCDLLLFIGSGLEPWLPGLLKAFPEGRFRTFEAAAELALAESGEEPGHDEAGHEHGPLDPHVWLDFELDLRIVDGIASELGRIDPEGRPLFAANAGKLKSRLTALDARFREGLAGCRGKSLVLAGHGAFGYLARRYGLVQKALYGLSPDSQPRPKDLMDAVDYCRKHGIRTVFFENSVPPDLSKTLAREIGGRVLLLDAGHNLTRDQQAAGLGFFDLMEENLARLRKGWGAGEPMDLIVLRAVSFRYDGSPVLVDIDLIIREGDFLAIIGPNGSGKTTLVKVILGLLPPTSGEVRLFGKTPAEFSDRTMIGYVPQKATHIDPFFPASVEEVVRMALLAGPRQGGASGRESRAKVLRALEDVGMSGSAGTPIGRLSGGQQQRAFIARALVTSPRILFLDEPTTGVDAGTQDSFYEMLDRLNRNEGLTIVLVTHDIGIVNKHVTSVACLNQKLSYHGSHAEFCRSEAFRDMVTRGDHLVAHEH